MEFLKFYIWGTIPDDICKDHASRIFDNVFKGSLWAIKMLDATAKLPIGLLTGNLVHYGNIDECTEIEVNEDFGSFVGKHCVVEFPLPLPEDALIEDREAAEKDFNYKWSVCIPSTCTALDLKYFLRYTLHLRTANTYDELCHTANDSKPFSPLECFTIAVFTILVLLALLSTLYDYFGPTDKRNELYLTFSMKTNARNLMDTKTPADNMGIVNGIRFIAVVMVIMAHVYMAKGVSGLDINRIHYLDWLSDWSHIWLTSRGIMVDTFFVFGGLLVSFLFMKNMSKGKKFELSKFYLHRYLRIAPAACAMLLFESAFTNRLGKSPIWDRISKQVEEDCAENWWKHVLFINNWWGLEKCMEHTWYLAADIQLYLLSPLLLIPLHRWPRFGVILTVFVTAVFYFISFGLSYGLEEKVDLFRNAGIMWERKLYRGTYTRATSWLIGFLLGFFLFKYMHLRPVPSGRKWEETPINWRNAIIATFSWIIILLIAVGLLAGAHPFIQLDYEYDAFQSSLYLASSHIVWSLCVVFFITASVAGYGGPLGIILSAKLFVPLSRLSYSVYIVHLIVVKVLLVDSMSTTYLSDSTLILATISITILSVFLSLIMYFLVETPFQNIDRLLLQGGNNHKGKKVDSENNYVNDTTSLSITHVTRDSAYINSAFELSERNNARKPT